MIHAQQRATSNKRACGPAGGVLAHVGCHVLEHVGVTLSSACEAQRVRSRSWHVAGLAMVSALTIVACGGGDGGSKDDGAAQVDDAAPLSAAPQAPLDLPARIPLEGAGAGDPAAIKVIRLWSEAVRRSDVDAASALWAVPSKVQNGTPVLTLASDREVRAFNSSLSCGSQLVSGLGAKGSPFIVAVFKLTKRPGADCGSGIGNDARTAIRVRAGKIVEWYRLPDEPADPDAPDAPPAPPAGPVV